MLFACIGSIVAYNLLVTVSHLVEEDLLAKGGGEMSFSCHYITMCNPHDWVCHVCMCCIAHAI